MGINNSKLKKYIIESERICCVTEKQVVFKCGPLKKLNKNPKIAAIDFCDDLCDASRIITQVRDSGQDSVTLFCYKNILLGFIHDCQYFSSRYITLTNKGYQLNKKIFKNKYPDT